jgi:hypothetical protein
MENRMGTFVGLGGSLDCEARAKINQWGDASACEDGSVAPYSEVLVYGVSFLYR